MSVAAEALALHNTWERVEEIERVASTMPEQDSGRASLHEVVRKELAAASPVRPRTAAEILRLTEKTVRNWATEGILTTTRTTPTVLLDPLRLHEVYHLIEDLREAGKTRGLLDEVHRRLVDQRLLEREDLAESLAQLRRGEGTLVRRRPATQDTGSRTVPAGARSHDPGLRMRQVADDARRLLAEGAGDRDLFRHTVAQMLDFYASAGRRGVDAAGLFVDGPGLTGDERVDAGLAGLAEYLAERDGWPVPAWVTEPGRYANGWLACAIPGLREIAQQETPAAFRRHGVLLTAGDLARA